MEYVSSEHAIKTLYGGLSDEQFIKWIDQLHRKIFWLLIYKDPCNGDKYIHVDYEKYFESVMDNLAGMNKLISGSEVMLELMTMLEASHIETQKTDYDFRRFRKYILDSEALVDKLKEEVCNDYSG